MHYNISSKRKNDAVMTIRQNNSKKAFEIEGLNQAAERITGYSSEELIGKDFRKLLPERLVEHIENVVDYETNDLAIAFSRIRLFFILNKKGEEIPVSMKLFYSLALEANVPEFELLMRDLTLINKLEELRNKMITEESDNYLYQFSENISLPSRALMDKKLDFIKEFINDYSIDVTVVTLAIDQYNVINAKYGDDEANFVIYEISKMINKTLRSGDTLCYLGNGIFGAILLDCNYKDMGSVVKRLKGIIQINQPISLKFSSSRVPVTVSSSYQEVKADTDTKDLLRNCIVAIADIELLGGDSSKRI